MKKNSLKYLFIIMCEVILLTFAIINHSCKSPVSFSYSQSDLLYNTGGNGFYLDVSYNDTQITSPEFTLEPGMYTAHIKYRYAGSAKLRISYVDGRLLSNVSGDIPLSTTHEAHCDFEVKYSNRPMQVCGMLKQDATGNDYLIIDEIIIEDSPIATLYFGFKLFIFFILINSLIVIMRYRKKFKTSKENQFVAKSLFIITCFSSLPLMVNYLPWSCHDLAFHLMRIEGLKAGLQEGIFPVRIQPNWLHGHGYATSVFYGDLFLYIPATLRVFGVPIQTTYQLYVWLINATTAFVSYWCFSKMSTKKIAIICSGVYVLNIYRLTCIYTRAAVGEYTAMLFLPLILYGFWKIFTLPEDSQQHSNSWIVLLIGCSGVLHSHLITCELVAFFVILTCIILWKKTFRRKTFLVLLKTCGSIIILNLWFLVPFMDYMTTGTYIINAPGNWVPFRIDERGSFLAQLFSTSYDVAADYRGHENGIIGEMPQTLGSTAIVVLCAWLILCTNQHKSSVTEKGSERICITFFLLSLLLSTHLVPYTALAQLIPILKFPLRSIQYVWRFLSLAALFMVWLTCLIFKHDKITIERKKFLLIAIVASTFWQSLSMMSDVLNNNNALRIYQEGNLTTCEVSGGEYLPANYNLNDCTNTLSYNENAIAIDTWSRQANQITVTAKNNSHEAQTLEIPLLYYKGYVVFSKSGDNLAISAGTSGRATITLPVSYDSTFTVAFHPPWYWRISEIISFLFILILCMPRKMISTKKKATPN